MLRARLVPLGVVAALLFALVAAFAVPSVLPGRTAAQSGCSVGTPLVTNPGFEDPNVVLAPNGMATYTPPGWTGTATAIRNGDYGRVGDLFLYVLDFPNGLTQTLPTAALGGATLYVEYISYPGFPTQIQVGSQVVPVVQGSATAVNSSYYNGSVTLPANPGNLTLTISPYEIDRLFITVGACGPPVTETATTEPTATGTATATATTAPTATSTATATATTEPTATTPPTATATATQPTAGPTMRPTARPRTTATAPATATSSVPTVRPTARPRG